MDDVLLLLIVIIILIISYVFFHLNIKKKEQFNQCQSFDTDEFDGYCKPYYGLPAAKAINPGKMVYPNDSSMRKVYNKEAARIACNSTPGCSGIFQNQSDIVMNDNHEAYLCMNEWSGTAADIDTVAGMEFVTHKCASRDSAPGKDSASNRYGNKVMLLYNLNGTHKNYTRHLDVHNHYLYTNMEVNDEKDYITDMNNNIIEEVLVVKVGEFVSAHLNRLLEFVRGYPDGIGIEVKQNNDAGSQQTVRFFKKRHSYSLYIKDYTHTNVGAADKIGSWIYTSIIKDVIENPYIGFLNGPYDRGSHRAQRISGNSNSNWPYLPNLWRIIRGQKGYLMFINRSYPSSSHHIAIQFGYYDGQSYVVKANIGHFQDGSKWNHNGDGLNVLFHYIYSASYMWFPIGPVDLDRANNPSISTPIQ